MHGAATRSVSLYLDRERALESALARGDRAAVDRLVADDFSLRTPASPDVVDRDAWWAREGTHGHAERNVRDLWVRESGDVAAVSFLLDPARGAGRGTLFVVDLWQTSAGKLLARHVSRPVSVPPPPTRPSGRE